MKTVLVVEDEMKIARVVRDYLTDAGFEVIVASSGEAALASARGSKPDLVVLDLGLPGVDGLDVARELRGSSRVPIVMLTARGEETDKIVGLELGADDYVVKPFSPKELVARVRAVLRRSSTAEMLREQPIRVADVEIDPQRMRVTQSARPVELTPTEFQLLTALAREPGRVFTRGQLLDAIHGVAIESYERAIDAHVKNIRKKLEPEPGKPRYVLTVHGVGYGSPMPEDQHDHGHPHGPPWGGPPWHGGGPWGGTGLRGGPKTRTGRLAVRRPGGGCAGTSCASSCLIRALFIASVVTLAVLLGGFLWGGTGGGRPYGRIGIVVIALAIFLIVRAGRRFASPVVDVMEAADRVAAGDYETRVEERGSREVRRLGRVFNEMTERLGTNESSETAAPRRRRARAQDTALGDPREPRSDHRRPVSDG